MVFLDKLLNFMTGITVNIRNSVPDILWRSRHFMSSFRTFVLKLHISNIPYNTEQYIIRVSIFENISPSICNELVGFATQYPRIAYNTQ